MKKYICPDFEMSAFCVEDVITQSGAIVNSAELTGKDLDMYTTYLDNSEAKSNNISVFTW